MTYEVKTIPDISEIDKGNIAEVNIYNWGGDYRPVTKGILCYVRDKGFAMKMICEEADPRAEETEQDAYVAADSCMEVFADFDPAQGIGYFNFEGNPNGAMLECFGLPDKHPRMRLAANGYAHPLPKVLKGDGFWGWELFLPLSLIETFYGKLPIGPGYRFQGNFYKCGDKTAAVHYGSYTKIDWPSPNFHRPEFFADFVIVE